MGGFIFLTSLKPEVNYDCNDQFQCDTTRLACGGGDSTISIGPPKGFLFIIVGQELGVLNKILLIVTILPS